MKYLRAFFKIILLYLRMSSRVSKEIRMNRISKCRNCSHYGVVELITGKIVPKCFICGCYLDKKILLQRERCPLGKW